MGIRTRGVKPGRFVGYFEIWPRGVWPKRPFRKAQRPQGSRPIWIFWAKKLTITDMTPNTVYGVALPGKIGFGPVRAGYDMVLDQLPAHFVRKKALFETNNGSKTGQNERILVRKLTIPNTTPNPVYGVFVPQNHGFRPF